MFTDRFRLQIYRKIVKEGVRDTELITDKKEKRITLALFKH